MKLCRSRVRLGLTGLGLLMLGCLPAGGYGQSETGLRVLPSEAITYTRFLDRAAFDARFPGDFRAATSDFDRGWYVHYRHENLAYYFGPVRFESVARDHHTRLQETVQAAQAQRPELLGYTIETLFLPTETAPETSASTPSVEEGAGTSSPPPLPPREPTWLERVLGIFRR